MKSTIRTIGVLLLFVTFLGTASDAAFGQDGPNIWPACGTARDPVLVKGEGFATTPAVKFDGVDATVLKRTENRILCIVPGDTSLGEVNVTVDGDAADEKFTVLKDGSPVVLRMSAKTFTPGTEVLLVGRRLSGAKAEFVDAVQGVMDTVNLWGGRRAAALQVPEDLGVGKYTLRITNAAGLDSGSCSPEVEVVQTGTPTLTAVSPAGQFRGQKVTCQGTNLAPAGLCVVDWTDASGKTLKSFGLANGYDTVVAHVPLLAEHGAKYEVVVDLRGDAKTGSIEYDVGTPGDPGITKLDPDEGPAWSLFRIWGKNFRVFGEWPVVEMSKAGETLKARVLGSHPGHWGKDEVLFVQVPPTAGDGIYDVVVKVGGRTSAAEKFTVGARELTVTSMVPKFQGPKGPWWPTSFKGTGFGTHQDAEIEVTWDNGSGAPRKGTIMFRSDVHLVVLPPGGWKDPLPNGTYTVKITLDPDGQATTVTAGTYTVW